MRHRRALWVSTAIAAVLCAGVLSGPARAQSVTGSGNVYGAVGPTTTPLPPPPLPVWSIPTEALYVGLTAPGTLTIEGGGSVSDKSAIVGNVSTGTVTVTGAGSTWHNSSVVNIGYGAVPAYPGIGTLTIEDGGYVYSGVPGSSNTNTAVSGIIGTFYAGVGTVTVSGTDAGGHASRWENAGQLMVGRYGKGTLTIEGGGFVSDTDGYIGVFADGTGTGNGTVTVSGSDGDGHASTWANSGDLIVGVSGTGTLNVEGGGAVSNGDGYIGYYNTGTVTVTGTDGNGNASTWANSGDLYVGVYGDGTLNIEAGGTVSNGDSVIGYDNTGTVTVTGTDGDGNASAWNNSGELYVGYYGDGTLTVGDGARASASSVDLGEAAGITGTINIGAAAGDPAVAAGTLDVPTVEFGDGTGTLVFNHTGDTTFTAALTSTGSGTHALDHYAGDTTLTGDSSGFKGTTTVEGGTLEIAQGGKLGGADAYIGRAAGSDGTVVVTGAGSTWDNTGILYVGDEGKGTLTVEAGGTVASHRTVIGDAYTGEGGVATVTGAGSTWTTGRIDVGFGITGTLTVADGGKVTSTDSEIGFAATGTATVTGAGSTWTSDYLAVGLYGNDGDGTLTVAEGGKVVAPTVLIGLNHGSAGTINIGAAAGEDAVAAGTLDATTLQFANGNGALVFNHTGTLAFAAALTSTGYGTHALDHYAGTTTLTGDSSGFKGTTTVEGGTLLVGDPSGSGKLGGTVNVGSGGTLGGSGTILGATTIDGTLSAGNSPGTLTFASDLTLNAGAASVFELNSPGVVGGTGASGNDLVVVGGNLTLAGTLDARVAAAGYYRLFNYGGTRSGMFSGGTVTGTGGFAPVAPNNPDIQYGIPHQVNLSVLATGQTLQFWDGPDTVGNGIVDGGAGTWSAAGTNWTGMPGEANVNGTWGGSVGVFAGAAGGTVAVSGTQSFDTLQFSTGGYVLQGGALAIGVSGGGTFNIDNGVAVTIGSVIEDGAGSLLGKTGAGTLVLAGTNTYTGGTLVQAGTLIGNTSSIQGNIANAGTVVFDQTGNDSFAGNIADYNGTNGTMTKRGAGILTLAGTSSLDWSVEAGGLVASAERFGGNAAISSAASLTFDQSGNAAYAGTFSGNGGFSKTGVGLLSLTGDSGGFAGSAAIENGTLAVNDKLGGALDVWSTGRLQGAGTVGDTVVNGTVAPGNNAIGTIHVGNITFNPGSIYEAEVDAAGQSDKIVASGTATINGGSVEVLAGAGDYAPQTRYTILTANAGGRSGTFDGVTSNLAFLDPSLSYDAYNAYLTMTRNDIDFAAIGETPNQRAAGAGADSLGFGNTIYDAVLNLSEPQARAAFDRLSGEVHASAQSALIEDSHFVRDAATNRIRAAFGAVGGSRAPVMTYADPANGRPDAAYAAFASLDAGTTKAIAAAPTTGSFALWGQGFGGWGHTNSDGNAARLSHSTGGFLVGGDTPVFDTWRLGMMAGYSRTNFNVKDRASSGASDNYHLGLYGGTQWGNLGFRTGATYTWHDVSTGRSVVFPGFSDSLMGDDRAGTAQVFGELGYGLRAGGFGLEPFANLAYVNLQTDGFTEKGGLAALRSAGTGTGIPFATLGLHASTDFSVGAMAAAIRGTLGWRHAFGDTTPLSTLTLAGGSPFTVAGVPIAKDALVLDVGLDLAIARNTTIGVSYGGQFGNAAADQSVKGNLTIRFD